MAVGTIVVMLLAVVFASLLIYVLIKTYIMWMIRMQNQKCTCGHKVREHLYGMCVSGWCNCMYGKRQAALAAHYLLKEVEREDKKEVEQLRESVTLANITIDALRAELKESKAKEYPQDRVYG